MSIFNKQIAIPQDHGSWVFILSPLTVGIFASENFTRTSAYLAIAAMFAFMLRQPLTMLVKSMSGRRPKTLLFPAQIWVLIYGSISALALTGLILDGYGFVLLLAVPGIPIFAWHLWLVSQREERKQVNVEIIATGVLSLAAAAIYWVGIGMYDSIGWWLWLFTWLQSAASIVYAYLRLGQREQAEVKSRGALAFTSFNLAFSIACGFLKLCPPFIFIPFFLQFLETIWGITHPATGWKPSKIGFRQLFVSSAWTILFILFWP